MKKSLFYVLSIFVIIINFVIVFIYRTYYPKIFLIPVIALIILSIICKIKRKKRIAYMLMIITVIMIGILAIYSNGSRKEAEDRYQNVGFMTDSDVKSYNEQFEQYEGEYTGRYIKSLIGLVISNNVSQDEEFMKVSISGVVTINKEDVTLPQQYGEINEQSTYSVKMNYNSYGKVESIQIENLRG